MGAVRNGAAEEDWRWDLNSGAAARPGWEHAAALEEVVTPRIWSGVGTTRLRGAPFYHVA